MKKFLFFCKSKKIGGIHTTCSCSPSHHSCFPALLFVLPLFLLLYICPTGPRAKTSKLSHISLVSGGSWVSVWVEHPFLWWSKGCGEKKLIILSRLTTLIGLFWQFKCKLSESRYQLSAIYLPQGYSHELTYFWLICIYSAISVLSTNK